MGGPAAAEPPRTWFSSESIQRSLRLVHVISGIVVFLGLILPYHINGRAWYDYGLSRWNPPEYHFSDGKVGHADYDPKFTRPATWPVFGKVFAGLGALAVVGIFAGVITSVVLLPSVLRDRRGRISLTVLYLCGAVPIIYNWCPLGWRMWAWMLD